MPPAPDATTPAVAPGCCLDGLSAAESASTVERFRYDEDRALLAAEVAGNPAPADEDEDNRASARSFIPHPSEEDGPADGVPGRAEEDEAPVAAGAGPDRRLGDEDLLRLGRLMREAIELIDGMRRPAAVARPELGHMPGDPETDVDSLFMPILKAIEEAVAYLNDNERLQASELLAELAANVRAGRSLI
jgi:hypothetical protein